MSSESNSTSPHDDGTPAEPGMPLGGADVTSHDAARLHHVFERRRRHSLELLLVCVIGLIPWTAVLALTLPTSRSVHAWRVTWVGFDVMLIAAMACTAFFGWRRHHAVIPSALATAVLLICDAWFDISLDFGTPDVWMSVCLAVFAEIPMAAFLIHRVTSVIPLMLSAEMPAVPPKGHTDRRHRPIGHHEEGV